MPRTFGSDQQRVDARRRFDLAEVDVEPVGAHQDVARPQVVADAGAVDIALDLVRQQDLDQVALVHRLFGAERFETAFLGQVEIRRARQFADDHLASAVAEVLRLGVPLGTKAQDGDGLVLQQREVGVVVVVDFGGHF